MCRVSSRRGGRGSKPELDLRRSSKGRIINRPSGHRITLTVQAHSEGTSLPTSMAQDKETMLQSVMELSCAECQVLQWGFGAIRTAGFCQQAQPIYSSTMRRTDPAACEDRTSITTFPTSRKRNWHLYFNMRSVPRKTQACHPRCCSPGRSLGRKVTKSLPCLTNRVPGTGVACIDKDVQWWAYRMSDDLKGSRDKYIAR